MHNLQDVRENTGSENKKGSFLNAQRQKKGSKNRADKMEKPYYTRHSKEKHKDIA